MPISKQDFLTKIRTKYPTYESIDDNTLYDSILKKYPAYEAQIDTTIEAAPVQTKDIPVQETSRLKEAAISAIKPLGAVP